MSSGTEETVIAGPFHAGLQTACMQIQRDRAVFGESKYRQKRNKNERT